MSGRLDPSPISLKIVPSSKTQVSTSTFNPVLMYGLLMWGGGGGEGMYVDT